MRADDRGLFKRGRRWWLRLYVRGEGKRIMALKPAGENRATTNKDVARSLARDIRRQITEHGRIFEAAKGGDLSALVEQFRAVNATESSEAQARENVCHIRRAFAKDFEVSYVDPKKADKKIVEQVPPISHVGQITTVRIQKWLLHLHQKKRNPKTRWNYLSSISRFCEFLIDRDYLAVNPCHRVKMARIEKLLPRFLSPADYAQVLEMARQHGIYAEVTTALFSGMRRGELRRMQWADVDFKRAVIMVPRSKSGRPRMIPMNTKLRDILLRRHKETGGHGYIFPGRDRRGDSGMRRESWWAAALAPLKKVLSIFTDGLARSATGTGWHLFRHTFASRLVQAGVPIAKVSAWLGHTDIRTTMIYAHLAPGHDEDIENV